MPLSTCWEHVWSAPNEIPSDLPATLLRASVRASVGGSVALAFPKLAHAFPETTEALCKQWTSPRLVARQFRTRWQLSLVAQRGNLNLFFDIGNAGYDEEGPAFESECKMLPATWRELYRYFWSFGITEADEIGLYWMNTPFSWASRWDIAEFDKAFPMAKSCSRDLAKLGVRSGWRCWLATDGGDTLWINEAHNDQSVFHVRAEPAASQPRRVDEPGVLLDKYLSHVLSGGRSQEFNFRAVAGAA